MKENHPTLEKNGVTGIHSLYSSYTPVCVCVYVLLDDVVVMGGSDSDWLHWLWEITTCS